MALSAYEAIRKEIYLAILENLERKDEEDKRFAPVGTAKQVLSDDRLRRFLRSLDEPEERYTLVLPRVTEDKLIERIHDEHLHRFLAVLIFAGCSIHGARAFKKALVSGNNSPALPSLPASREGLSVLFDGDVPDTDKFVANQPVFCTLIIYGGQEQNLHNPDQFRLPYIEQLVIGNGAFGPVFRVKVAKGHFVDRETGTANLAPVILARKDYKLRRHGKRIDILETILSSSPVRCMNIIETLGQLNLDSNIRSVFMPLAIGDLWTFMQAHDEHRPNSIKKRERLIRCAVGLARGLEFLHNGLSSPTGPLACFHRDLTPQHILVYHAHTEPRYIWKISSFEIAQIKTKEPQAKAVDQSAFVGPQDRLSGSDNDCIGYEGTYLAPEAFSGDPAGAEADVWSLGCVLSVLFAYMEDGAAAITQYAEARVNQQGTGIYQTFFVRPKPTGLASLHPAVIRTHRRLVRETTKRDDGEGKILEDALRYLEQHVLQASPARRENAANVVLMLERTAASYEKVRSATPYMMARFVSRDIEPQQSVLMGVKPVPRGVAKEYEKQSWTERLRQILGRRINRRRKRQPDSELESQSTQPSVQHVIPRTNQGRPRPDSMHSMATKKDRVSLSSAPEELAVSEYDVASRATGLIGLDPTATSTTYKSDHIFSTGKDVLASWTDVSELDDSDGTSTIYSDTMSLPESTKDSYALELCEQLIRGISSYEIPNETAQKTFEALPDYLQAFALRFGSCPGTASQARGDIMAFVHKYREYVV
ncbi:kinase-like domain-containing protein [Aspergillus heterothallicus]